MTLNPTNATNKNVIWSSSNTKVAIVDKNRNIKAIGERTATITVTTNNGSKKATYKVNINNPYKTRIVKFIVNLPKNFKKKHYVEILD